MARRRANIAPSQISRGVHLELISWADEIGWREAEGLTNLRELAIDVLRKGLHKLEQYQILTTIGVTAADVGSAAEGDDNRVDSEISRWIGPPWNSIEVPPS
ncbi:hypothetical protein BHE74_00046376 [Ensete ventricosum]|nr:hypothetical protein BHE74_00046376 [Ensete ventricosum]